MTRDTDRHAVATAAFIAIAVFFVLARSWSIHDTVFPESGNVHLYGVDSYFHLRHAAYSAENFPDQLRLDPGARFPNRNRQQVTGLFNLMIAATARIGARARPELRQVATATAWAPLMLSTLTLWLVFRLALNLAGPTAAVASAMFFTVYPGTSITRGMLGFGDQHVAEFLLAFLSVFGLVRCIQLCRNTNRYTPTLLLSFPFAAFFYSWIGAPMYIAVMAFALLALLVVHVTAGGDPAPIARGCFRFFSGVVIWQLFVMAIWPELQMELVRNMRWWNLGGMIAFATLPIGFAGAVHRLRRRGVSDIAIAAGTVLAVALAATAFFSGVPRGKTFLRWLIGQRGQQIAEQQIVSPAAFWRYFGPAGVLAAIGVPVAFIKGIKRPASSLIVLPVAFGAAVTAIWLRTHDFDYVPPVFISFTAGIAFVWIAQSARALFSNKGWSRLIAPGLLIALLFPMWPLETTRGAWLTPERLENMMLHREEWFDAMQWLSRSTPVPPVNPKTNLQGSIPEVYPEGTYGVISAWDFGNFIATYGNRLPVASRFPSRRAARWLTSPSEALADSLLCPACTPPERVRYAVIDAATASNLFLAKVRSARRTPAVRTKGYWQTPDGRVPDFDFGAVFDSSMVKRLYWDDGAELGHYRMVYDSPQLSLLYFRYHLNPPRADLWSTRIDTEGDLEWAAGVVGDDLFEVQDHFGFNGLITPRIKIFEIVPGARVIGFTDRNADVRAELDLLSSSTGRRFTYTRTVRSDSTGRFELRLPYSTILNSLPAAVQTVGAYRVYAPLEADSAMWRINISESAVLTGATHRIN
ncbi:MAG: hypothetical protein HKN17_07355 [Rhodothermales bacterium]|nr:hypothetical protein [Rhodothermales bacterium]